MKILLVVNESWHSNRATKMIQALQIPCRTEVK